MAKTEWDPTSQSIEQSGMFSPNPAMGLRARKTSKLTRRDFLRAGGIAVGAALLMPTYEYLKDGEFEATFQDFRNSVIKDSFTLFPGSKDGKYNLALALRNRNNPNELTRLDIEDIDFSDVYDMSGILGAEVIHNVPEREINGIFGKIAGAAAIVGAGYAFGSLFGKGREGAGLVIAASMLAEASGCSTIRAKALDTKSATDEAKTKTPELITTLTTTATIIRELLDKTEDDQNYTKSDVPWYVITPTKTPDDRGLRFTPTKSATATPTFTPTFTLRPTETPTPTETLKPTYQWSANFENDEGSFSKPHNPIIPGVYEYIDDPTKSSRGKIFSAHVKPDLKPGKDGFFRLYPNISLPSLKFPLRNEFDFFIDGLNPISLGYSSDYPWLCIAGLFDQAGSNWHANLTVNLEGSEGKYFPVGYAWANDGSDPNVFSSQDRSCIQPGKWSKCAIEIDKDKNVTISINGKPVCKGKLHKTSKDTIKWAHWGLYSGPVEPGKKILKQATLYNDNISITSWG